MGEFEGVVSTLRQALKKRGYNQLTPVQKAVLAPGLKQADALVSAQTGSGKTVAFGLTIATTLLDDTDQFSHAKAPVALVVAPTRELALQVKRELEWLYEIAGAIVISCVGGMDMRAERRDFSRNPNVVVGTPGRLRDHIERGSFNTKELKAVVLDEADEMLDLGFRDDLEYILDATPKKRRTLMFSATVPRSIANLAKQYQRNAVRVTTTSEREQHLDIEYRALTVAPNDRENAIVNVLRYFEAKNALIFCSTRATVNHMTSRFKNRGFSVVALSGELSQNERTHALQAMRDGRARVCVATDVAARGIDLPDLELVIHADMPKSKESLLHRSGRTGRAGRKGVCAIIVPHNFRKRTERLLSSANVEATWAKPPSADEIMQRDRQRILEDPALSNPMNEFEQTFVNIILKRYSAEQIAAAFVRQSFAERTAPEELIDTVPIELTKKQRNNFTGGVWFSLSVGREQNAEPRWLLPMLCRAGHITKDEIGAIRIHQTETHVELTSESVEEFIRAIGPTGKIEKNVTMTRIDGSPQTFKDGHKTRGRKVFKGKREFVEKRYETAWAKKPKNGKKVKKKNKKKLDRNKKAYESQFAVSGGNSTRNSEPGSSPLKRKKI
jgi:ATP-dependent RNA helicase DeaD